MTIVRNKYGFTVLALVTKTNIKNTSVIRTQKTKKKKKSRRILLDIWKVRIIERLQPCIIIFKEKKAEIEEKGKP